MTDAQIREQQVRELILRAVMAVGTLIIAGLIVGVLLFRNIPEKNEIILGTVIGFVFGNMVGPIYRQFFAGLDADAKVTADKQADALKSAVDKLPTAPMTEETR